MVVAVCVNGPDCPLVVLAWATSTPLIDVSSARADVFKFVPALAVTVDVPVTLTFNALEVELIALPEASVNPTFAMPVAAVATALPLT